MARKWIDPATGVQRDESGQEEYVSPASGSQFQERQPAAAADAALRQFIVPSGYQILERDSEREFVFIGGQFVETEATITIEQEGYRFRNDDGSESAATWRQAQDVVDSIAAGINIRLRILLNASGDPASSQFQLEYRKVGNSSWLKIE